MVKVLPRDFSFYCDVCERQFRIASDHPNAGQAFTVACPTCGRKARVERLPNGGIQIVHREHVFICPKPLNRNPLIVTIVYFCGVIVVAAVYALVAHFLGWWLCPVVLIASITVIGLVGAIQLSLEGQLNNNFVDLIRIFYKALPNLLGKRPNEGIVTSQ